jgi:C-3',4' desaturase CrtD
MENPANPGEKSREVTGSMSSCIVIGAGIGGLTSAAVLARAGIDVTVLEAQVYPGGCASTFFHQGYLFDTGATLAGGFYPGGPMEMVARATGITTWQAHDSQPAMQVHLPNEKVINRWRDERRWDERKNAFGAGSETFWRWQERTAEAMWDFALALPAWPPQSLSQIGQLTQKGFTWLGKDRPHRLSPLLLRDALQPISKHLKNVSADLKLFIDAQLLISAQTTSEFANALYGAAALDLPQRGVVNLKGGMGRIAQSLAQATEHNGGRILYRQEVTRVVQKRNQALLIETKRGNSFHADMAIINLPVWNIRKLMGDQGSILASKKPWQPRDAWGAFVMYIGLDGAVIPGDFPLHHQIVTSRPLGEGNSVFLSISPAWDETRAPLGKRAITLSTHTRLNTWWDLFAQDQEAYEALKGNYATRMLATAQEILPGLRDAAEIILPGTPVTFQRFTRRIQGWVGGYPQINLFQNYGPQIGPNLWMVGDSIFPGQSTAAVALGGIRVANMVLERDFSAHEREPHPFGKMMWATVRNQLYR